MVKNGGICIGLGMLVAVGCTTTDSVNSAGNDVLGIARFKVDETASLTTVTGLDAANREVARLELTHGRFTLTEMFVADYPGIAEVDGRMLHVTIGGDSRFLWETAGYEPVLHMPAHPAKEWQVAAFLDDSHVKPILDRWQIGFEAPGAALEDETVYGGGNISGTNVTSCATLGPLDYQCGTARGSLVVNECGGTDAAYDAKRVTRTSPYQEYVVTQCCPASPGSGVLGDWWAQKSCPTTGSAGSAVASSCGTAGINNACKGCGAYSAEIACKLTNSAYGGVDYCYQSSSENTACYSNLNGRTCSWMPQPFDTCYCSCYCNFGTIKCDLLPDF